MYRKVNDITQEVFRKEFNDLDIHITKSGHLKSTKERFGLGKDSFSWNEYLEGFK